MESAWHGLAHALRAVDTAVTVMHFGTARETHGMEAHGMEAHKTEAHGTGAHGTGDGLRLETLANEQSRPGDHYQVAARGGSVSVVGAGLLHTTCNTLSC